MDTLTINDKLHTIYDAALPNAFPGKFAASVLEQLQRGRDLSDKQLALIDKLYTEATTACPMPTGAYIGKQGLRMACALECVATRAFISDDAPPRHLNTYADANGATLVHWTGAAQAIGARGTFKFTVKAHGVFAGVKQTTVTRLVAEKQAVLI